MVDHLWAGWRMPYIEQGDRDGVTVPDGLTLFEAILGSGLPDEETYVLWRGEHTSALLNAFPYTSGHLMVLPNRAVAGLADLDDDEHDALWTTVRDGVAAVQEAYGPDGINVGANLGRGAGAGVPDHLHVHVVPRWSGDTNFMTATANVRVLPEALVESWGRLRAAWPQLR